MSCQRVSCFLARARARVAALMALLLFRLELLVVVRMLGKLLLGRVGRVLLDGTVGTVGRLLLLVEKLLGGKVRMVGKSLLVGARCPHISISMASSIKISSKDWNAWRSFKIAMRCSLAGEMKKCARIRRV